MNQWSRTRKRIILALVFFVLIVLIGLPIFFLFYRAPTCNDFRQNGDEIGVDCGGSCQLLCTSQSLPLISRGDPRVLKVEGNTFEVVTLIENSNIGGEVYQAGYIFKLYGASSTVPLKILEGETYVPKGSTFAVFEGPFSLQNGVVPTRATFEWKEDTLVWQKNDREPLNMTFKDVALTEENVKPRIDAVLVNNSLDRISNIDLVVLVSEGSGNFIAASKTFVENLLGGESSPITFTWPQPFEIKEKACDQPVDVVLVVDRSGSMDDLGINPPQPLTDVKNTALDFINQLGRNDRQSLITFANEASQPIDAMLGVDIDTVKKSINNISILTNVIQNTNIGAGINAAREELNSPRHRNKADKVLVLLTDGAPTLPEKAGVKDYPKTYALESAESAKQDGINIYTIGLGKDINMDFLKKIATTTTEGYFSPSTKELSGIYKQIVTKICKESAAVIDIYVRSFPDRSFIQ